MIIFNGVIPDGYPGCGMEYILTINILVVRPGWWWAVYMEQMM